MLSKRGSHYGEKQIIARKAAALIQPGQTIGLIPEVLWSIFLITLKENNH